MTRKRGPRSAGALRDGLLAFAAFFLTCGLVGDALAQGVNVPMPQPSPLRSAVPLDEGGPAEADLPAGAGEPFDYGSPDLLDVGLGGDGLPEGSIDVGSLPIDPDQDVGPPADIRPGSFTLEARLQSDGPALADGVRWRIFGDVPGAEGHLPLLGEASGGVVHVRLDPGAYYIHAAYGHAGATRRIDVSNPTGGRVVVLHAGGMRLLAINGQDDPLPAGDVLFDIYAPDEGGTGTLLVSNSPPGRIIGLGEGTYHVVCRYGDANAVVRADIRVEAGKLTEATMYQKAARLTLKLVEVHGGEALADTAWSVITPAGESVLESVGAFPSVVLAAGDYRAIARHDGRTYEGAFKVDAGIDRDIEVLLE
jgi:hypothetical protein